MGTNSVLKLTTNAKRKNSLLPAGKQSGEKSILFSIVYKIARMLSLFIYGGLLSQEAPAYILRLFKVG